jgi:hypothetical protein
MKFKACCAYQCALGGCETRENGGCYCLCRLFDRLHALENVIEGKQFVLPSGGSVYYAEEEDRKRFYQNNKEMVDEFKINKAPKLLEEVKSKIKEYEMEKE